MSVVFSLRKKRNCFRVLIKGSNILLRDVETSQVERLGFYTTRFVKAPDAERAKVEAFANAEKELNENGPLNEQTDPPVMEAVEVEEVPRELAEDVRGFTFFPDETS